MASDAKSPKEKPLSFMEKLSSEVSIYRPSETDATAATPNSPKLIIIASWTNASDVHVAKYIIKYKEVFPQAEIALIKSTSGLFFNPPRIVEAVKKVIPIIKSTFDTGSSSSSSQPELLIHIFSNGGSSSIASLYDAYAASATEGEDKILPQHVTIIDSAPSEFAAERLVAFLQVGVPTVQRLLTAPILYLVGYSWGLLVAIGALTDWLSVWGNTHNDNERNNEARRIYIYSESDVLVDYRTVESHASAAEKKGFNVQKEKFVGSAHVAHARKDEDRYWNIVQKTWYGN
ncbi:hypothetical protein PT974_00297 [Cladobotryum mycophilum]|uniref:Indole-diterpene biosynthesis protein PaxU n=1 Tax=Cladobotryum mycophilum TaxID=491253 RepID=A0ABR0T0G7_9HYPO